MESVSLASSTLFWDLFYLPIIRTAGCGKGLQMVCSRFRRAEI
ncbi:hypothetical protein HanPSC8_Chr11g0499681 [Helianthus annuus]|nr:hypothetical protein HanPSC8_Chr11g0499681 [Helianthus annuus]